jgi:hypothetical protein
MQRHRFKQLLTLSERLEQEAERLRAQAKKLSLGRKREELVRKVRQAETATHIDAWLASPGLRAPQ